MYLHKKLKVPLFIVVIVDAFLITTGYAQEVLDEDQIPTITNAKAADMTGWTIKMRNDASTGDPQDKLVSELTEEASPASGDLLVGMDGATGELRHIDIDNLPGGAIEGTVILSTGVPEGLVLKTDGDNSSSWEKPYRLYNNFEPESTITGSSLGFDFILQSTDCVAINGSCGTDGYVWTSTGAATPPAYEAISITESQISDLSHTTAEGTTVSDTAEIDLTLTTLDITGALVASSIDETKLDASTNASLDLADTSAQISGTPTADCAAFWSSATEVEDNNCMLQSDGATFGIGGTETSGLSLHIRDSAGPEVQLTNDTTGHTASDGIYLGYSDKARLFNYEGTDFDLATNATVNLTLLAAGGVDVVGALDASGAVTGSNLSGTNTGDDDVPEAGDFAAGTDFDLNGALNTDSVSANELNATGVEAELEGVMDLQDMQGAVTDAQVPDNITIDGAWVTVVASVDTTNSTTSPVDITDLEFTPAANTSYEIKMGLLLQADAVTTGVRLSLTWPTGLVADETSLLGSTVSSSSTAKVNKYWESGSAGVTPAGAVPTADESYYATIEGILTVDGSPSGTLKPRIRSEVASSVVRSMANSFLKYRVIE